MTKDEVQKNMGKNTNHAKSGGRQTASNYAAQALKEVVHRCTNCFESKGEERFIPTSCTKLQKDGIWRIGILTIEIKRAICISSRLIYQQQKSTCNGN